MVLIQIIKYFKSFDNLDLDNRKLYLIKRYSYGKVLNVGCGNLYIEGAINIDINKNFKIDILADFHKLPFKNNSFDTTLALDVIEHTKHPEILVKELLRVTKENGHIVIECLDFDVCKHNWHEDPTHVYYFNYSIFKHLLEPYGFKVFYLYGGMMVGIKNPRGFDRLLCIITALLGNQLRRMRNLKRGEK